MILKTGNMWQDSEADAILFTANSTVRKDGALVMGRGAALEAQKLFPGINKFFGEAIKVFGKRRYGVIYRAPPFGGGKYIGAFQVKCNYREDADLSLIEYSTDYLLRDIRADLPEPGMLFAVNFPGIGWGRLKREDVLPIISKLPDNVEIWSSPDVK